MKRILLLLVFFWLPFSQQAHACSPVSASLFKPTLERWEQHPGPKQQDSEASGDYWEKVPAGIVKVVELERGTRSTGYSCDDVGRIVLEVSLPANSSYSISEFGFYTRVTGGADPEEIFPTLPVSGFVEESKVILIFPWFDGAPKDQNPLDMTVELILVTNDLSIGPSTFFEVTAPVGGN